MILRKTDQCYNPAAKEKIPAPAGFFILTVNRTGKVKYQG